MKKSVYKKLLSSERLGNIFTLYLYNGFEKWFDIIREIKILKSAKDWDE